MFVFVMRLYLHTFKFFIPSHAFDFEFILYPVGQIHWKLPGVLRHCPLSQSRGSRSHSLISTSKIQEKLIITVSVKIKVAIELKETKI